MIQKLILFIIGLLGFLAILLGAIGAHWLSQNGEMLHRFETASKYHFYHTLLMLILFVLWKYFKKKVFLVSLGFILSGIILFSGSIYCLVFYNIKLGPITPIGGLMLMLGWLTILSSPLFLDKE